MAIESSPSLHAAANRSQRCCSVFHRVAPGCSVLLQFVAAVCCSVCSGSSFEGGGNVKRGKQGKKDTYTHYRVTWTCIHTYVHIYIYRHTRNQTYAYTRTCTRAYRRACIRAFIHTNIYSNIHASLHLYVRANMHTYSHS